MPDGDYKARPQAIATYSLSEPPSTQTPPARPVQRLPKPGGDERLSFQNAQLRRSGSRLGYPTISFEEGKLMNDSTTNGTKFSVVSIPLLVAPGQQQCSQQSITNRNAERISRE